ncbi:MAG: GtrA family protein, partial [Fervidicoccaceae archaeon]
MGLPRAILSLAAELMARLLVPEVRGVRDPMSGFFGFRRGVLGENGPRPRGFKILLHLLARGRYRGGGIVEVEYEFARRHAGKSKLGVGEIISFAIYILELNEYRALKFALVGLSGVLVNEGVLWLLHAVLGLPLYLSGALSIELSVLNNFTWNSLFTFRRVEASGGVVARLFKYHLAVAAGLAVNYSLLLLFSLLLGLNPLLSNLVGIAAGFLANYALSERYVWRRVAAVEGGVEC